MLEVDRVLGNYYCSLGHKWKTARDVYDKIVLR